jgi:hypothetical protein
MRISDTTPKTHISLVATACMSLALTSLAIHAEDSNSAQTEPYEWSAQLVSFDETAKTAVLQARVESHARIDGLEDFSDGDRLILTWTGRSWASGIRGLAKDPELTPQTLALPIEFVSAESNGQYVNFRIHVPDSALEAIADMEIGSRVTGTSPRMAADWSNAVSSLRHYNDVE